MTEPRPKPPAKPPVILHAHELTRAYGPLVALDKLSLVARAGQCIALMGANGSGKTTAAELIAGLTDPTSGWVKVCGFAVHSEAQGVSARRYLAYVSDTPRLYDDLTVADHLRLVAAAHGATDKALDRRIADLLERLGLDDRADFFPSQLSRGMRQKTALACALVRPFSLLLLDEPVVGLDTDSIRTLGEIVRETLRDRRAVLLMTHSDAFAATVATRILRIEEGRMVGR